MTRCWPQLAAEAPETAADQYAFWEMHPTFFINGRRHYGSYDITTLTSGVLAAKGAAARR